VDGVASPVLRGRSLTIARVTDPAASTVAATRVGGRYVLLAEIGRGGMATVHRGHDEVLDRPVAVKILHRHLAVDPTFLDRFRREARAAAALAHPNVVGVFDWGETPEGAYLVLQLVEGPTLREVLQRRGRLSPEQTAAVLLPVAAGLGAAHRAGLVHRDVKPENLLLGTDGTPRVTDFGLARAAASTSTTFGTDVLVGSPHYVSPEAVRGRPLDARCDVYALGVVLFECLTGRPPHQGESPYATALAHAASPVPPPSSLLYGLDPTLDEVVAWATAMDPAHRYVDATDFARALGIAVPERVSIEPLVDPEAVAAGARPSVTDGDPRAADDDGTLLVDDGETRVVDDPDGATTPLDRPRRRRGWLGLLLVLVLVATSGVGGYLIWDRLLAPVVEVPDVRGMAASEAVGILEDAGLSPRVEDDAVHHREVPAGHVVTQDPLEPARSGHPILLVLSAGPRPVTVDDVRDLDAAAARAHLEAAGLEVTTSSRHDDDVATGAVVGTDPEAGTVVDEGTGVVLLISQGPRPVDVPELVGGPLDDAMAATERAGLELDVVDRRHDASPAGTVIDQDPPPGETLAPGGRIGVVVSEGPPPVEVPQVRGLHVSEATRRLTELGFEVVVERRGGVGAFLNPGQVFDQDPGPGSMRRAGDTVTLFAYEG
jgi:eukaryotic-like serine/threonine-protein kinase